jgi:hypothetical protein
LHRDEGPGPTTREAEFTLSPSRCPNCNKEVDPSSPDVVAMQRMMRVPATREVPAHFVEVREAQLFHRAHAPRISDDWRLAIIDLNDPMTEIAPGHSAASSTDDPQNG